MKEVWKDIQGFEGHYQVSKSGKIKSLIRKRVKAERILKLQTGVRGYIYTKLSKNGHHSFLLVHRLVAKAFLNPIEHKLQINHKNGIKADNEVSNLEWCTPSENIKHAYKIGLREKRNCENATNTRFTNKDILDMYRLDVFLKRIEIAKIFDTTRGAISSILNKKYWKQIHNDGGKQNRVFKVRPTKEKN